MPIDSLIVRESNPKSRNLYPQSRSSRPSHRSELMAHSLCGSFSRKAKKVQQLREDRLGPISAVV